MRIHYLKTWPGPFAEVVAGRKRFEFRKDDRGYAVGDILVLYYWDPAPARTLPGQSIGVRERKFWTAVRVTYVLSGKFGVPSDYAAMSFVPENTIDVPGPLEISSCLSNSKLLNECRVFIEEEKVDL